MSPPAADITITEAGHHRGRRPSHRLMSITSGPISEGMIPSVRTEEGKDRQKGSDSTEHICMFSLCLMFIGIPIIVVGILCLSIATPFGLIMTMVGIGTSITGTLLVILAGMIALLKSCVKEKPKVEYAVEEQTPEIIIEDTLYSENFENNLCEEIEPIDPDQVLSVHGLSDLPSLEKLDPVYWSNYPEAQNPKSYLQSFGDLPKVMPSPDPRNPSRKKRRYSQKSKKSKNKIGRKISQSLGMAPKRKTLSRTSLTHSEEIQSDGSSSSLSSGSSGVSRSTNAEQNSTYKISANGFGVNHSKQSIITIENVGHSLSQDSIDREELTTSVAINDKDCNHNTEEVYNETDTQSVDKHISKEQNKEQNSLVINGILPDECTDNIELTEIGNTSAGEQFRYTKDEEFDNYSDLWNSIRRENRP